MRFRSAAVDTVPRLRAVRLPASKVVALAGSCAVLVLSGACSEAPEQPTKSFSRDTSDTRVYTAYRQSDDRRVERVDLGARARFIRVRIECSADEGWVSVTLADKSGSMSCARPVGGGSIAFGNAGGTSGPTDFEIRAPKDAEWSIAVDTRARAFDPTGS